MAEKTNENHCYISDVAYFSHLDDEKPVESIPEFSRMYDFLSNPNNIDLTPQERIYVIQKFLFMNDLYAYLYNEGYLRDDEYVSNVKIDEQEHTYSFTIDFEKILSNQDLLVKILDYFDCYTGEIYIDQLIKHKNAKCLICGECTYNSTSLPRSYYSRKKRYQCCNSCNLLNYDKQSKLKYSAKELDKLELFRYRNELITTLDY